MVLYFGPFQDGRLYRDDEFEEGGVVLGEDPFAQLTELLG